jgi:thymidylate kinase
LDGSGKTTQALAIREHLRLAGGKCVYRHNIKDSIHYFLLHRVVGTLSENSSAPFEKALRSGKDTAASRAASIVKKAFLFLELICFNLRYLGYKGSPAKHIICDRYFYDELVQAEYLGIGGRPFKAAFAKLIMRPDIAFFLEADPKEAFERKKEYDSGYYGRKGGIYHDMADKGYFEFIPASGVEETAGVIRSRVEQEREDL